MIGVLAVLLGSKDGADVDTVGCDIFCTAEVVVQGYFQPSEEWVGDQSKGGIIHQSPFRCGAIGLYEWHSRTVRKVDNSYHEDHAEWKRAQGERVGVDGPHAAVGAKGCMRGAYWFHTVPGDDGWSTAHYIVRAGVG